MLEPTIKIAHEAGKIILKFYKTDLSINVKADQSPVTEADMAASHFIVAELKRISPYAVVSEEDHDIDAWAVKDDEYYWLVDPIDGTKGFIARNHQFSVNIALIHANAPVLGVVYSPVDDLIYAGGAGIPAFREHAGKRVNITTRRVDPEKPHFLVSTHRNHERLDRLKARWPEATIERLGSSLKICRIAEGSADIYIRKGPTSEWDTAAAQGVLEAAGGSVESFSGSVLRYNKPSLINESFVALGDRTFKAREMILQAGEGNA